jgi:hypothetical protein
MADLKATKEVAACATQPHLLLSNRAGLEVLTYVQAIHIPYSLGDVVVERQH